MKISIIVPVYNVEQYIKECFGSIAAQTYKGEIECIFVDDCGQDKSVDILEELIADYHGCISFSIIHHEHNKGLSGARNTGIKNATGDYLYFLDSDDTITPDCIEKLAALAEKYPGVEVVQGSADTANEWLQLKRYQVPEYSNSFRWIRKTLLRRSVIPMTAWNKLLKRDFIFKYQLFFVEGMVHEDEVFNFMLAKHVQNMAFCLKQTYIYKENVNGIMHNVKADNTRYFHVVDYMSKHTDTPLLANEIESMVSLLDFGAHTLSIYNFLDNIPCYKKLLCGFLNIRNKVNTTSKFHLNGFLWRILYRCMEEILDVFYVKKGGNNYDAENKCYCSSL